MAGYSQANRLIQVYTPLGDDVLLLQGFSGSEGISRLFEYDLRMHSENRSIAFESIVGKKATIALKGVDGSKRYINGIVSTFWQGGYSTTFAYYQAKLVPWLWALTRTSECRIYQNMTVPDLLQAVFK